MQYDWISKSGADMDKHTQAVVAGSCLGAVLVIALLWLSGLGLRQACEAVGRRLSCGNYPDPACEFCGQPLDGRHAGCTGTEAVNVCATGTFIRAGYCEFYELTNTESAALMVRGGIGGP